MVELKSPLEGMIHYFARLPGLGKRSARRIALHLLKNPDSLMIPLADSINLAAVSIKKCDFCGNLDIKNPCNICEDSARDSKVICVVEEVDDLWALERGNIFKGVYHVLGGNLSAIDGRTPDDLNISGLISRIKSTKCEEIIIATSATIEGQTTAHYIAEMVENSGVKITRLAQGIPSGGELDYLDDGTLQTALRARHVMNT